MLKVKCPDGKIHQYAPGTKIIDVAKEFATHYATPIAEAVLNGKAVGLPCPLENDSTLDFVELNSIAGNRVYVRTLFFAFITAMAMKRPEVQIELRNSLGNAIYCNVKNGITLSKYDLEDVHQAMQELIDRKEPVELQWLTVEEAKKVVRPHLSKDTLPLLDVVEGIDKVPVYRLKDEWAFFLGNMLPDLGYIKGYKLMNYKTGVLITYPTGPDYNVVPEFVDKPKLAKVYDAAEELGQRINCSTVSALNKFIKDGNSRGIIQISEARHEKEIAAIADKISNSQRHIRLVLIAGPSSSGKTTFSQRLAVQMRLNGLQPMPISLDNYFKERVDTPRLPDGSYDFECLEALDLELFNSHLERLIAGDTVKIPHYSFRTGQREFRGQTITLGEKGVLVVEGIHGLNERLSAAVDKDAKLKIYISALTPLSFDDNNRIYTSDMRLMRRMVRDSQFRSHDALGTLRGWSKVREGEEKYIFPFAEEADVMLNTTLIYEFAVFKKYAEPLLKAIPLDVPESAEAQRLLTMLRASLSIDDEAVPNNSIIREFVGGSIFGDLL